MLKMLMLKRFRKCRHCYKCIGALLLFNVGAANADSNMVNVGAAIFICFFIYLCGHSCGCW